MRCTPIFVTFEELENEVRGYKVLLVKGLFFSPISEHIHVVN